MTFPWQVLALALAAVFEFVLASLVRSRLRTIAVNPFTVAILFNAGWAALYGLELYLPTLAEKQFCLQARGLFMPFFALVWFETAYRYALARRCFHGWRLVAAAIVPAITVGLNWFPPPGSHALLRQHLWIDSEGPLAVLRYTPGLWAWVQYVYSYSLSLWALLILVFTRGHNRWEQNRRLYFVAAVVIGAFFDQLYFFGLSPTPGVNYAPIFLPVTSTIMCFALFGRNLLDFAPLARATLIEHLEDLLIVIDNKDFIIDLNRAASRRLGITPEKAARLPAREILAAWPGLQAELGRPAGYRTELLHRGEYFELSVLLVPGPHARILHLRDISQHKQAELAILQAKEKAEAAEAAQSRFLAMMSHEIRTPMNGVIGFSQLLTESPLTTEQREYVNVIDQSGRSLLVIVNDVLDYSKIAAGQLDLETVPCNPAEIATRVCRLLGRQAAEKGITLTCQIAPSVPVTVIGDPVRLGQILTNLAGNAIKFTSAGGVTVELDSEITPSHDTLIFRVRDTGIGIPPEQQARIFLPFSQADASTTRRFGGTGLGLAITSSLCELMQGSLKLESHPGQGSLFTATLRVGRPAASPASETAEPATAQAASSTGPLRLLVFEDNPVNQIVMRALLRRLGHEVHFVADGEKGLALLARESFDALFMDIEMPVMDGYEATRQIRTDPHLGRQQSYIIALTAHALKGERERCIAAGMNDFLTKPVTLESLRLALDQVPSR